MDLWRASRCLTTPSSTLDWRMGDAIWQPAQGNCTCIRRPMLSCRHISFVLLLLWLSQMDRNRTGTPIGLFKSASGCNRVPPSRIIASAQTSEDRNHAPHVKQQQEPSAQRTGHIRTSPFFVFVAPSRSPKAPADGSVNPSAAASSREWPKRLGLKGCALRICAGWMSCHTHNGSRLIVVAVHAGEGRSFGKICLCRRRRPILQ